MVVKKIIRGLTFAIALSYVVSTNAASIIFRSENFNPDPVFSNVASFFIHIEITGELEPGVYFNPDLEFVNYTVSGSLNPGTPSGFPSFNLVREITGEEFYQQGSSINFEIAAGANLEDGLQLSELVDTGSLFVFNGREIDNGRFHPALLELYADGSGRIQNSNNTPSLSPLVEVGFGDEYITDLLFVPDEITIYSVEPPSPVASGGSGSISLWSAMFAMLLIWRKQLTLAVSRK